MAKAVAPVTEVAEVKTDKTDFWFGTGRRKSSVARVRMTLGGKDLVVNDKPIAEYFPGVQSKISFEAPLKAVGRLDTVSATIKTNGGGKNSQLGAVVHGIARALVAYDETLRPTLSRAGYLRRDPRMRESRHFGLMGARKAKSSPTR